MSQARQSLLVLDYGSPYTQLIARYIREAGVFCEIVPGDIGIDVLQARPGVKGIVLSDNYPSSSGASAISPPAFIFEAGVPVLGVGYGMHAMAQALGGQVQWAEQNHYQKAQVRARGHTQLLDGIDDFRNEQGHGLLNVALKQGDTLINLPEGFIAMATTASEQVVGMADESRQFYGLQFLPELAQTPQGKAIITRFVSTICQADRSWSMAAYVDEAVAAIRQQVGTDQVLLGLSGGVDSSVAAALIHKAIGKQLSCVFVDHGLLRLNEAEQVLSTLGGHFGMNIIHVDAANRFLEKLSGVADPEAKRKIIGGEFIEVFETEAKRLSDVQWLAQGTIYPDVIESVASRDGQVAVKSHHNVGGLPDTLKLKLLEPLRNLFKHEVRELGLALGLPPEMVFRHPFPGPGLGVRILGEIKSEYADILRQADAIFIDELKKAEAFDKDKTWYDATSQAFAVFLPIKSVGTVNDQRRYGYVIALRAVQTSDFMNAKAAPLPFDLLERVAERIIHEIEAVSRVTYDISGKPPATIEWE